MKTWETTCPLEIPYIRAAAKGLKERSPSSMIFTAKGIARMLFDFPKGNLESEGCVISWNSIQGTNGIFIKITMKHS